MDLYQEIIAHALWQYGLRIDIPNLDTDPKTWIENSCYQALTQIKGILVDENLDDPTCFQKIEAIVKVFEDMGSDGGGRHDFG